jgi:four helix bundle protein
MEKSSLEHKKGGPLRDKTFQLAVRIVKLCNHLVSTRHEYIVTKQLFRSGTNPGAMVREAMNAESGLDFIHKLSVAQKETGETQFWIELLYATGYINEKEYLSIHADTEEIMKLLRSSILTKKKNLAIKTSTVLIVSICTYFLLTA